MTTVRTRQRRLVSLIALAVAGAMAHAEEAQRLGRIEVTADSIPDLTGATTLQPANLLRPPQADASALLPHAPGAATVRNGGLTGIAQLRGLFNERVRVEVDGMQITPACPNHMDPPLHYTAPSELDTLAVLPGITPVSAGGDSIAGTIQAKSPDPDFFAAGKTGTRGEAGIGYSGMNDATTAHARVEAGNDRIVASLNASYADADDIRFPGGRVQDTRYTTQRGALRLDAKTDSGRAMLELGARRAKDAGTPTLPMDMIKDDADRIRLAYSGNHRAHKVEVGAYWHDIEHLMDNYSMRPNKGMRMEAPAESRDAGLNVKVERPGWGGTLRVGGDLHSNAQDVYQRNIATRATQDTLRDATRERIGLFGEWDSGTNSGWRSSYGLRVDHVMSDAGNIASNFAPSNADRIAFNARDHQIDDTNVDFTAQWSWAASKALEYQIGLARKSRSPSLLERYLWTPLSASAGQADGRTYLGNLDLDPEVSHQLSLGLAFKRDGLELHPALFYNRVSDFIQGMPIARRDAAGLPVLQYQNLEAELYGLDGSWRWALDSNLALGGTLSYVRAENTETGDNLYRIAPLNGRIYADLKQGAWNHRAEVRAAAAQDEVAAYNGERETSAWAVLDLHTRWKHGPWQVSAGVENLLDAEYHDHLAGINRVAGGDVAVGAQIPAAGRFAYLEAKYFW